MSDGVLTRAIADLERAGIPLAAVLDPAQREDILRAPGIGRKAFGRLQDAAINASCQTQKIYVVKLRLTPAQFWALVKLGGMEWVRSKIDSEGLDP